jgi:predicted amidophosphoribosyltransferase
VLLVDDVLTTGTTIREASRLLRSLGADAIEAAVVAVTPAAGRNADRKMST